MTRQRDLARLAELLVQRRGTLEEAQKRSRVELTSLEEQDRDPEYEEAAQVDLADYTLTHLIEGQRRELMMIDAALIRMEDGSFGECVDCGTNIPLDRLEALPFAIRCEEDARAYEEAVRGPRSHATL